MLKNILTKTIVILLALSLLTPACRAPSQMTPSPTSAPPQTGQTTPPQETPMYQWGEWRNTDPYRPYGERITVSVVKGGLEGAGTLPAGETIEDNRALKYIEDTLNIDVVFKWVVSSDAYLDKLNLAIASKDIPDVMIVDSAQLLQLTEAGAIEDLTPYIEKYASPSILENYRQTRGLALQAATINGRIMGIPNVQPQADAPIMAFVRRDWLNKLGLEPPRTVADIEKIARAFIEQDPDGNGAKDTYGLTGTMNPINVPSNLHGFDAFFNAYGAFPEMFYRDRSGKIVYGSVQPETKEALGLIARWYKEGLIDPEFATKDAGKANEIPVSGKSGIMMGPWWIPWWPLVDSVTNDPNADWWPYLIQDKNGDYTFSMGEYTYSFVVVRKGYPHPEVALKILNVEYDLSYGLNNAPQFYPNFNEIWTLLFPIPFLIEEPYVVERMAREYKAALEGQLDPATFGEAMKMEFEQIKADIANPRSDPSNWATRMARLEAGLLLAQGYKEVRNDPVVARVLATDPSWPSLKKLEEEFFLQIMTGARPLDDFDKFVREWYNSGGQQLLDRMNQQK